MDNPNITMEEYIRLEEEKARRHGKVYNWETAKYGKIWYYEDIDDLRSIETEFPDIVFNDRVDWVGGLIDSDRWVKGCERSVYPMVNLDGGE
ncbi:hypothetical protein Tco_0969559 [Tanacetum coccineum]